MSTSCEVVRLEIVDVAPASIALPESSPIKLELTGPQGPAGSVGPTGPQGLTGATGPQGPAVSPGGSSGQIQFNDAGAFGGAAALVCGVGSTDLTIAASGPTRLPLKVKAAAGQSANIFSVQLADGSEKLYVDGDGHVVSYGGLQVHGGFYPDGDISFSTGRALFRAAEIGMQLGNQAYVRWHDDVDGAIGAISSELRFDALNALGLRNGANAQTLNIYESADSGLANHSHGYLKATAGGDFEIGTAAAGTGVRRGIKLNSTNRAAKIDDPTGGAMVDAEARAAIDAIVDILESFGLSAAV